MTDSTTTQLRAMRIRAFVPWGGLPLTGDTAMCDGAHCPSCVNARPGSRLARLQGARVRAQAIIAWTRHERESRPDTSGEVEAAWAAYRLARLDELLFEGNSETDVALAQVRMERIETQRRQRHEIEGRRPRKITPRPVKRPRRPRKGRCTASPWTARKGTGRVVYIGFGDAIRRMTVQRRLDVAGLAAGLHLLKIA